MPDPSPLRVVVVGAGISGLVAARELRAAGVSVTVLDKGRSVGGRLATRRIGAARLDHGAQFFTVRTPAFQRRVDDWVERGLAHVWCHGFGHGSLDTNGATSAPGAPGAPADGDGYPRYVASGGMNSLAKDLAVGIDVEVSTMVFSVRPGSDARWDVVIDDGSIRPADAVIITAPLPQAFSLLVDIAWQHDDAEHQMHGVEHQTHGVELDESVFRVEYDRTIALLCTVDGPSAVPEPGGVQQPGSDGRVFSFIGDNQRKGVSDAPALTFHASAEWSEEHWDDDLGTLESMLAEAETPWLGSANVIEAQVKKWRLATPRSIWPEPCWSTAADSIIVAGDAFAGPRVEGAHNSGLAAAHLLLG